MRSILFVFLILLCTCVSAQSTWPSAPDRGELGDGPYPQLILRGLTLINGNCAAPHRAG